LLGAALLTVGRHTVANLLRTCEPTTHRGLFSDDAPWTSLLPDPTTHRGPWWRDRPSAA